MYEAAEKSTKRRRNHLGTHKCQNPISAPLVQDKSYTVRWGECWGVSICFHEATRETIMEMKEDKSRDTDHQVQQGQKNRCALRIGALDKKGSLDPPLPLPQTFQ